MPGKTIDPISSAVAAIIEQKGGARWGHRVDAGPAAKESPSAATETSGTDVVDDLVGIARESSANARTTSIGSIAGGQLRAVGFTTAAGYLQAIRNGVPARTHALYLRTLSDKFKIAARDLADLPGPMIEVDLPSRPGIVHQPRAASIPGRRPPGSPAGGTVADVPIAAPAIARPTPRATSAAPASSPRPTAQARRPPVRVMAGSAPVRRATLGPPQGPPQLRSAVAATVTMMPALISQATAPAAPPAMPARATSPATSASGTASPSSPPGTISATNVTITQPQHQGDDASVRFSMLELD